MSLMLITPPLAEPLTLAEAKAYLRVEHADDDDLIAALIAGARGHVEAVTRRALLIQTWRLTLDCWPADGRIVMPLAPATAVTAAHVYDTAGPSHAVDVENFVVDAGGAPALIAFPPWAVPPPGRANGGITLDVTAGYGDAAADVPPALRQAIRQLIAQWYENRGIAAEATLATLPAGVAALLAPFRVLSL